MNIIAELQVLPPKDLIDEKKTMDFLKSYFKENDDPLELHFVITAQDFGEFNLGKRPDIKRWIVREMADTE